MVWMGACGNGTVLGPFFFDGNVNGAKHLEMLNEEVFPLNLSLRSVISLPTEAFLVCGGPKMMHQHTLPWMLVSTWMTEFFRHNIIALHHPNEWPRRSPDLTPYDFFLWGYLNPLMPGDPIWGHIY